MSWRRIRWSNRLTPWAAVCGLALAAALPAGAQAPVPVGAQFQINTYTTDSQFTGSVAAEADGDFIVVWSSRGSSGTDTSSWSVQGQRYASGGSPQGVQFQVNTYTTGFQAGPSVAAEADGDFVVVWQSDGSSGTDTSSSSVQGQRYASDGSTRGAEFQVNTYTPYSQGVASVATATDGDFVVAWGSYGPYFAFSDFSHIQAQRFASDGSTQGAQFQVDTYTTSDQRIPSLAVDADGDFVVVWQSRGSPSTDASGYSAQGQRYASDGSAQGAQFQVNSYTTSDQKGIRVAAAANGDFVVAWSSVGSSGTDTSVYSVQGQRYRVAAAAPAVPAMSPATRFSLGAPLMLVGTAYALRRRA